MIAHPRDGANSVAFAAAAMSDETAQRAALAVLRMYEEVSRRDRRR